MKLGLTNSDGIENAPVKLTVTQQQILDLINANNNITREAISKTINKDLTTVRRAITKLKELKIIERIGSDKSGHWEIK
jgi:ATP-dependent DNA helicase RecG